MEYFRGEVGKNIFVRVFMVDAYQTDAPVITDDIAVWKSRCGTKWGKIDTVSMYVRYELNVMPIVMPKMHMKISSVRHA